MLKVSKFGGSSLSDSKAFLRVKSIIKSDIYRKVIVVSAPGKGAVYDKKITDLLINYTQTKDNDILNTVKDRFKLICDKLNIDLDIDKELSFDSDNPDYIISRGEYITAKIMAKLLNYGFVDAKELIFFKDKTIIDKVKTKRAIKKLNYFSGVVIPGFYGGLDGKENLLCRGGSDITGAILSRYLKSQIYENFTDVNGINPINPKIIKSNIFIDSLSFKDFIRLDALNPTVLHKWAYKPVYGTKTKIIIKNTFMPYAKGTTISKKVKVPFFAVFSIASQKDFLVITGRRLLKKRRLLKILKAALGEYKIIKKSNTKVTIKTKLNHIAAIKRLYFAIFIDKTSPPCHKAPLFYVK